MNKQDIIDIMAEQADISKAAAERALNAFTDTITNELGSGNEVVLVGFGTWSTSERAAREGRNPKTGETIQIPAKKKVAFRASKDLKSLLA